MLQIFKNPNFKFMKYKYIALAISSLVILIGVLNMTVGKGINQGIDFAGGTLIRLIFQDTTPISEVRQALAQAGLEGSRIQELENSQREYMIRAMQEENEGQTEEGEEAHEIVANKILASLRSAEERNAIAQNKKDLNSLDETELILILETAYPDSAQAMARQILGFRNDERTKIIQSYDHLQQGTGLDNEAINLLKDQTYLSRIVILSKEYVGPQIGHDLRRRTTQATIWALIGMLIYIGLRFKFAYGVSAILTLAHDVLITLGVFSLTQREMNLPVIAAILTIVGYSLNDTIVIFDRVRDNIKTMRKTDFTNVLDTSINQTLSRTVITSGTTLLTVTALFIFGGSVINDFAFTMMIGVAIGTYSSVFQSCSILFFWNKFLKPSKGMGK
jgi:preprotein translocase subunit SecF